MRPNCASRVWRAAGIAAALALAGCTSDGSNGPAAGSASGTSGTAKASGAGDSGPGIEGPGDSGASETGDAGASAIDSGAFDANTEDGTAGRSDAEEAASPPDGGQIVTSPTSCETTCGPGYICVEDQEVGTEIPPDDAGVCRAGGVPSGGFCPVWAGYHCVSLPSSCIGSAAAAECGCAASLCNLDELLLDPLNGLPSCSAPSPTLMVCTVIME